MNQIEELRQQGLSLCGIAEVTGFDRKTIRKYLANPDRQPKYGPRQKKGPRRLDPFKAFIDERLAAGVWNAVVLLRELRERGYVGGYSAVKEYVQPKREEAHAVAVRRFEPRPKARWSPESSTFGETSFADCSAMSHAVSRI